MFFNIYGEYKEEEKMGYALFAARKQVLNSQLNSSQLQQTQRGNEQFALATTHTSLQQQVSSLGASQSSELASLYGNLSDTNDSDAKSIINADIKRKEEEFKTETDAINIQIYEISMKENANEMEVKRLDTVVTKLQSDLEAIEQAEGQGIERSVPKFSGLS